MAEGQMAAWIRLTRPLGGPTSRPPVSWRYPVRPARTFIGRTQHCAPGVAIST
jgi:hypothetical protein